MYLNKWDLSFNPEKDIPKAVPVWVKLPHLPLHYLNDEDFKAIGNTPDKYVDKSELKTPMLSCTRICVEVDLDKGLPESINLSIDGWYHLQTVDYEKIPFKWKYCHEYGHFAKTCLKKPEKVMQEGVQEEGWNVVSGKRIVKNVAANQSHATTKSASKNRFEALQNDEKETDPQEENVEEGPSPEQEVITEDLTQ